MAAQHLVFTQSARGHLDVARARNLAQGFFGSTIEPVDLSVVSLHKQQRTVTRLVLRSTLGAFEASFDVQARARTDADDRLVRDAEARGGCFGMGLLVGPCAHVWEVRPVGEPGEAATWTLCAVLAATGLGPVLPPDRSTLLGVRAAYARGAAEFSSYR
ncbi:MAG: hypothetical protein MUF54_10345 [Polyangiaceae bacterium]|nr:hypothetical protein [Polyangiaceae bacterium]